MKKFIIYLIKFYQLTISSVIGFNCRFIPTCSNYAIFAIEDKGIVKGIRLIILRIFKCHPWGGSGYDPVNKNNDLEN